MISKQQAHAAAVLLRKQGGVACDVSKTQVSPEVLAAALAVVESTPETSAQRMADGRQYVDSHGEDSRVVASMMIQRIISDSIR